MPPLSNTDASMARCILCLPFFPFFFFTYFICLLYILLRTSVLAERFFFSCTSFPTGPTNEQKRNIPLISLTHNDNNVKIEEGIDKKKKEKGEKKKRLHHSRCSILLAPFRCNQTWRHREREREKENVLDSTDVVCSSISSFFFFSLSSFYFSCNPKGCYGYVTREEHDTHKKNTALEKKKKAKQL